MRVITTYTDDFADVIEVTSAKYIGDFAIRITFNDSTSQLVDFKHFLERSLHPSIRQYMDEKRFRKFEIVDGNLNWNNYELIFPLEDLYENKI